MLYLFYKSHRSCTISLYKLQSEAWTSYFETPKRIPRKFIQHLHLYYLDRYYHTNLYDDGQVYKMKNWLI